MSEAQAHAALMDRVYRHQRYVYDFSRKYYLFGRDRLIRSLGLQSGERLVEIGCGTGRNLVRMARSYPEARLYGIDISEEMLISARRSLVRAGLEHRVGLIRAPAEALTPDLFGDRTPFDRILFSYSLSMIPYFNQVLRISAAALSPEGLIHIVDFGDLTGLGAAGARLMKAWLNLFHVCPRTDLLHQFELLARRDPGLDLYVLPMRYAFVATLKGSQIAMLTGNHVAP